MERESIDMDVLFVGAGPASLSNGAQLIQFTCNGGGNQTWKTRRR